ncbi:MAG: helix-turn-helix domain-containing protein [bacterium]|nr:helix-turn-helix domain-containing protein [bacterium]
MFHESYTIPPEPSPIGGMALRCVWDIHADQTYDVAVDTARRASVQLRPDGGTGLIAFRTLDGIGRVHLKSGEVYEVRADSLLLVEWGALRRHHTLGDRWRLWWLEFDVGGLQDMPHHRVMAVPAEGDEDDRIQQLLQNFRQEDKTRGRLACAQFQALLYGWITARTDGTSAAINDHRIQAVIEQMYNHLDGTLSVPKMAKMAHLSGPHFRRLFARVTGTSPKKFYNKLRLAWADHLLRNGSMNVTEIADALGFSSPFHFSRTFHTHFGHPPSHLRRRKPEGISNVQV